MKRAPWLGWPPKIANSRSGEFFVVAGGAAGIGMWKLLHMDHAASPERYARLVIAFTNLLVVLVLGPSVGAALHWCVRRLLQMLSSRKMPD